MLRIRDKSGKTKFVWSDEDEEPVSIDELILTAPEKDQKNEEEQKDASGKN